MLHLAVVLIGLLAQSPPIRVAVLPIDRPDGFTDLHHKRLLDSRSDLWHALRHAGVRRAGDDDPAVVCLKVLSSAWDGPNEEFAFVTVELQAGDFRAELKGDDDNWRGSARQIARQVRDWVRLNRERLSGVPPCRP